MQAREYEKGASKGAHLVVVWELRGKDNIESVRHSCQCQAGCCTSQLVVRHMKARRTRACWLEHLDQVDGDGAIAAAAACGCLPRAGVTAGVGSDDDAGGQACEDIAEFAKERVKGGMEQRESHC